MEEDQIPQPSGDESEGDDREFQLLVDAMSFVVNEPTILAKHYLADPDRFPQLSRAWPDDQFNQEADYVGVIMARTSWCATGA